MLAPADITEIAPGLWRWLDERAAECDRADLATALRPLLDLPVERVLVSHRVSVLDGGRGAIERALGQAA